MDGAVVKKPPEHVVLFGSVGQSRCILVIQITHQSILDIQDHGDRYAKNEDREAEEKEKEAKLDRQLTMYLDKGVKGMDIQCLNKSMTYAIY